MFNHLRAEWHARIAAHVVVEQGTPLQYPYPGKPHRFSLLDPNAGVGKPPYFTQEGLLAFLDAFVGKEWVLIGYVSVRKDHRGKGYARMLVQEVYDKFPDRLIDWGRLMEPEMEHLFHDFKQRYPARTKGKFL